MAKMSNEELEQAFNKTKNDLKGDNNFQDALDKANTMFELLLGLKKDDRTLEMVEMCYARAAVVSMARLFKSLSSEEFAEKCTKEPVLHEIAKSLGTYSAIIATARDVLTPENKGK